MEHDARLLIGRTITMTITKTPRRTVFRECIVEQFYPQEAIWMARDTRTRDPEFFDLADIIEGRVTLERNSN